jgi:hypothetical protein
LCVSVVLTAKSNRIQNIFNVKQLKVKRVTDMDLLKVVLIYLFVQSIILIGFSSARLSLSELKLGSGSADGKYVNQCSQQNNFMIWIGIQLAFLFTVMVGAAFMAFKTRNVPSAFDESAHIANAIFLLIFFAVIIVPLDILVQDSPNASIIIQGIGQCFLGLMLLVILFGPKLYHIATGNANSKPKGATMANTGANTGMTTGSVLASNGDSNDHSNGSAGINKSKLNSTSSKPAHTSAVKYIPQKRNSLSITGHTQLSSVPVPVPAATSSPTAVHVTVADSTGTVSKDGDAGTSTTATPATNTSSAAAVELTNIGTTSAATTTESVSTSVASPISSADTVTSTDVTFRVTPSEQVEVALLLQRLRCT